MRIHVLCVSKRPRDWVTTASDDYLKRLQGQLDVSVREIAPVKASQPALQADKEAEHLRRLCPQRAYKIALDEKGKQWSTLELADALGKWRELYADVVCFVGGAQGLADGLVGEADRCWSLSRLTLPHQLARVVLVEQLYRAWSVLQNHPYHRA